MFYASALAIARAICCYFRAKAPESCTPFASLLRFSLDFSDITVCQLRYQPPRAPQASPISPARHRQFHFIDE